MRALRRPGVILGVLLCASAHAVTTADRDLFILTFQNFPGELAKLDPDVGHQLARLEYERLLLRIPPATLRTVKRATAAVALASSTNVPEELRNLKELVRNAAELERIRVVAEQARRALEAGNAASPPCPSALGIRLSRDVCRQIEEAGGLSAAEDPALAVVLGKLRSLRELEVYRESMTSTIASALGSTSGLPGFAVKAIEAGEREATNMLGDSIQSFSEDLSDVESQARERFTSILNALQQLGPPRSDEDQQTRALRRIEAAKIDALGKSLEALSDWQDGLAIVASSGTEGLRFSGAALVADAGARLGQGVTKDLASSARAVADQVTGVAQALTALQASISEGGIQASMNGALGAGAVEQIGKTLGLPSGLPSLALALGSGGIAGGLTSIGASFGLFSGGGGGGGEARALAAINGKLDAILNKLASIEAKLDNLRLQMEQQYAELRRQVGDIEYETKRTALAVQRLTPLFNPCPELKAFAVEAWQRNASPDVRVQETLAGLLSGGRKLSEIGNSAIKLCEAHLARLATDSISQPDLARAFTIRHDYSEGEKHTWVRETAVLAVGTDEKRIGWALDSPTGSGLNLGGAGAQQNARKSLFEEGSPWHDSVTFYPTFESALQAQEILDPAAVGEVVVYARIVSAAMVLDQGISASEGKRRRSAIWMGVSRVVGTSLVQQRLLSGEVALDRHSERLEGEDSHDDEVLLLSRNPILSSNVAHYQLSGKQNKERAQFAIALSAARLGRAVIGQAIASSALSSRLTPGTLVFDGELPSLCNGEVPSLRKGPIAVRYHGSLASACAHLPSYWDLALDRIQSLPATDRVGDAWELAKARLNGLRNSEPTDVGALLLAGAMLRSN
jgi:hypothetical protein